MNYSPSGRGRTRSRAVDLDEEQRAEDGPMDPVAFWRQQAEHDRAEGPRRRARTARWSCVRLLEAQRTVNLTGAPFYTAHH